MLINANGYTLHPTTPHFEAAVVDNGTIVAIGTTEELTLQYATRVDRVLDVAGATVVPGFVDSHVHISGVGEQALRLNLFDVRSGRELLDKVAEYARGLPRDAWILGSGWNDNQFVDKEMPSITELEAASGGRPTVLTRVCCHAYFVNQSALRIAGIDEFASNPQDGKYGRDSIGRLNGLLYENAGQPVLKAIPEWSYADWYRAFKTGMETALRAGITAVHTDDVRSTKSFASVWNLYHQLIHQDGVRLRIHELVDWHYMDECLAALKELPKPDEWLEQGAAKLFSDGALGGRTAWFLEDYSDAPGWKGTPMYSRQELIERVRIAHEKGFGIGIHAIGDAGLEATIAAMELAPRVTMRDRIIHAELVNTDLIRRMAALGDTVVVDIQPRFTVSDFPWIAERVGPDRLPFACAWKTLQQAGLHLAGGSDSPIEPIEPLLGIHAAVVRRKPYESGAGYLMEQALSPVEALRLFTIDACFANQSEHQKGLVAPGWLADFTVLDKDIVRPHHADDIRDARVLYTIVGGDIAYAQDGKNVEWSA